MKLKHDSSVRFQYQMSANNSDLDNILSILAIVSAFPAREISDATMKPNNLIFIFSPYTFVNFSHVTHGFQN